MVLRSTAAEPRPTVPLVLRLAEVWPRIPLMSTSVWSGDRPRSVAGRIASVASLAEGRGKLIEGATVASAVASSVVPCRCRLAPLRTSTGATLSRRLRPAARVPVTMMSWPPSGLLASAVEAASATGADWAASVCGAACGAAWASAAALAAARSSLMMVTVQPLLESLRWVADGAG
ncbi:hypothetical protein WR25_08105 [Diploscapter pachys]|uniref:Uncharacterized protein n=1 Tax=Diploscapter pachys TaxID=2018661 RepID=A0A2A2KB07_9BILA|nr:hypothetical protein WR25_08105 [Diploscapter pachys]